MTEPTRSPSHAERARTLVASRGECMLSTLARDPSGHPFGSYVEHALVDGTPIFLISALAEHTKNLEADARASLLVVERERAGETALARGRVTLLGRARRVDRARVEDAFLARHPDAKAYASFRDFAYWELAVESARYVGGFGRMSWVEGDAWSSAEVDPLLDGADGILAHMNDDHAGACVAYARVFGAIDAATSARMIGVDRYGFELRVETSDGARTVRIAFPAPVTTGAEVRKALVAMVREARAKLA